MSVPAPGLRPGEQFFVICDMMMGVVEVCAPARDRSERPLCSPLDSPIVSFYAHRTAQAYSMSVSRLLPTTVGKECTDELRGQDPHVSGLRAALHF